MSQQVFSDRLLVRTAAKIYNNINEEKHDGAGLDYLKKTNEEIKFRLDSMADLYNETNNKCHIINRIISNNFTKNKSKILSRHALNTREKVAQLISRFASVRDNLFRIHESAHYLSNEKDNVEFSKISSCQSCFDIICDIKTLVKENKIESIRGDIITVKTNDIILSHKGINYPFNSFLINLDINKVGGNARPYTISSNNPHRCAHLEDSIHPHVSESGYLCEGIAGEAITMALSEGRLLDLFSIVESILNEYNPRSPYIPLQTWDFENQCRNCGNWVNCVDSCGHCGNGYCEECMYVCEECDAHVCANHVVSCCNKTYCIEHATKCPECGELHCENCTVECSSCEGEGCKSCTYGCSICKKRYHRHHKVLRRCASCEALICNGCSTVSDKSYAKLQIGYYYCSNCYKELEKDRKSVV